MKRSKKPSAMRFDRWVNTRFPRLALWRNDQPKAARAEEMKTMGTIAILGYALGLLPTITLGIQTLVGDQAAGKDKEQMALDELAVALQGAAGVLAPGGTNAALAGAAGGAAAEVIDITSTIATLIGHLKNTKAVTTAVNFTKATGAYQAATAVAKANAGAAVAAAPAPAAGEIKG